MYPIVSKKVENARKRSAWFGNPMEERVRRLTFFLST